MTLYYNTVEVVYLRNVLEKMGFKQMEPTKIYTATSSFHDILERIAQDAIEVVTVSGRLVSWQNETRRFQVGTDNGSNNGNKPLTKVPFHKYKEKVLMNEGYKMMRASTVSHRVFIL